ESFERDEAADALALDVVREADDRRFGHFRVRDQSAFDLHRAQPVTGDVEYVVNAAHHPVVAVLIAASTIASEVTAGNLAEVRLHVAVMISIKRAQHTGPRLPHDEQSTVHAGDRLTV